jgi:hypothetical protein
MKTRFMALALALLASSPALAQSATQSATGPLEYEVIPTGPISMFANHPDQGREGGGAGRRALCPV